MRQDFFLANYRGEKQTKYYVTFFLVMFNFVTQLLKLSMLSEE